MISKVVIGNGFYGACRYVCMDHKRAVVLETEGVRNYHYKLMADDFQIQQQFRQSLRKAVFHGILSFYPGEKIADEIMIEIARKYLAELKINNTQYAITKHTDKDHLQIFTEIEKDANEGGHAFQDIQGDVYEMLLSEIASAGKNGQFRTPRHIIKLMTELVAPQLGQRIGDPSCGTAGFLLGAYQFMLTQLVLQNNPDNVWIDEDGFYRATITAMLNDKLRSILDDSLFGFDFDTTMVRLGLMNMMMHGIDEPNIDYKDTLSKTYNEDSRFDVVMANPPFTGNIDKGDINENLKLPTTKTELLFVERIFTMLKMGGTAAVIVPSGVIQNAGKAFEAVRKMLIDKAELKAVIALPSGVFKPYAGVSTAILLFTKGGETNNVWFYNMQADGYTLDDKRNKITESDLPEIATRYKNRSEKTDTDRKEKYFMVPKKEIVSNDYDLNLSTYKEEVYEEVKYDKPHIIFGSLETIEETIQDGISELKKLIQ